MQTQRVGFTAGDMFETEWSDADVVWITATRFAVYMFVAHGLSLI